MAIAMVSCASLLLELALTRLFSVVLFYHFAFLAISVALLGLGAGGVFSYIRRQWLRQWDLERMGAALCIGNAVLVLVVLEVVLHSAISLTLSRANFARLTLLYLFAALPFFTTGCLFSVAFARAATRVSRLYGFDLLGGAAACLLLVPLLNILGGPNTVLFAAVLFAAAGGMWAGGTATRKLAAICALLFLVLIVANWRGQLIDIVYAKGMRRDQPWMEWARWNAISRIEVDNQGGARYVVIDADASTAIMNVDPRLWDRDLPASGGATYSNLAPHEVKAAYNWKADLMRAAPSVANILRPRGDFAIIGPGGGVDVLRAVANGSKNVTAIEINPLIATSVMRGAYAEYAHHLYERPEVKLHVSDGRSFVRASHDQYDVVQMTLVDTWASTAAGAFALSENNLYTVEAFKEYFDHLKPDGYIAITRWEFKEPREALRVVSQAIAALQEVGVRDPSQNFIVVSDGALDRDGRPVTVLAKKSAFTEQEERAVIAHTRENPTLFTLYSPRYYTDAPVLQQNDELAGFAQGHDAARSASGPFREMLRGPARDNFQRDYAYNVAPVYDGNPFFFFTLKTSRIFSQVAGTEGGVDWKVNVGIVVLGMVLAISFAGVLLFLLLPLIFHGGERPRLSPMLYFVAIGLGYILVEITLIQRFVLFLGHPTYALTVVVFLMLLASGAGSLASRRWLKTLRRLPALIVAIVAAVAAYLFVMPRLLAALVGLPLPAKIAVSALLIAPLAFAMGMPFPSGLRAAEAAASGSGTTEWAWAMNASASVLGSVLAMVIAIQTNLNVTLLAGAGCYVVAAMAVIALRWNRQPAG